jgi:hypothetical protein
MTKEKVIQNIIIRLTLEGSLSRNKIYNKKAKNSYRKDFRNYLAKELKKTLGQIISDNDYTEEKHFKKIISFSARVSKKHKEKLFRGCLKIGVSQKLINLFWKLSWLLKKNVREPIHCPFDRIVINELGRPLNKINWTEIKEIDIYKDLIASAKMIASKKRKSIADWELKVHENEVNYD